MGLYRHVRHPFALSKKLVLSTVLFGNYTCSVARTWKGHLGTNLRFSANRKLLETQCSVNARCMRLKSACIYSHLPVRRTSQVTKLLNWVILPLPISSCDFRLWLNEVAYNTGWSDVTESMVTIRSPFCNALSKMANIYRVIQIKLNMITDLPLPTKSI